MQTRRRLFVVFMCFGLSLPALSSAAADRPAKADETTTERVEAALHSRNLRGVSEIEVVTRDGQVQLSGFVDSEDVQEQALEIARAIKGVNSVRNDLVVREAKPTQRAAVDDTIIEAKVRQELKNNAANPANEIQVEVSGGVVQLSGFVASVDTKTRAADIASTVAGVRDVRNDIALEH
jgi:hyperosmotically inducible periplasmic protein